MSARDVPGLPGGLQSGQTVSFEAVAAGANMTAAAGVDLSRVTTTLFGGGIGDLASDAKGTGARFNTGKPDLSLIPLHMVAASYIDENNPHSGVGALFKLSKFQLTGEEEYLDQMIVVLGLDGWEECAAVFDYGKRKYKAWNWAKGMPWSVPVACAARHLLAMIRGETIDIDKPGAPGSQLPHRGHVFCNIVMLKHYLIHYAEGNDLPPKGLL